MMRRTCGRERLLLLSLRRRAGPAFLYLSSPLGSMGLTSDDNRKTALKIQNMRALEPGMSFPLDTACDGILHRDEILLPA